LFIYHNIQHNKMKKCVVKEQVVQINRLV